MDINFFFRRFHPINFWREGTDDITQDENDRSYSDDFSRTFSDSPNELFQQIEDMFNSVVTSFGMLDISKEFIPVESNPRSFMLKDSDGESSKDSQCSNSECMLKGNESEIQPFKSFHNSFYSQFSSKKTVYLPDGKIEEYQTFIDNDGKKTSRVKRTIHDSTYEVITKSNKQGITEKEENFENLDENKLPDFEKTWTNLKTKIEPSSEALSSKQPDSKPSYFSFLKKIFGSL